MLVCPLSLLAMFVTYWKGGKKEKKQVLLEPITQEWCLCYFDIKWSCVISISKELRGKPAPLCSLK